MKAYQETSTSVAKSQENIRWILSKYKAEGVQFSEDWVGHIILVRFLYRIEKIQYSVLFKVPIPEAETKTPNRGFERSEQQIHKIQEQHKRGIWRAVYWAIKSRMEAVEFGIESFQEAFLSHFEVPGTDKQIGEIIIPKLAAGHLKLLEQ